MFFALASKELSGKTVGQKKLYVVSLPWNDSSHSSPRIRVTACPTRNKMNVAMHHCLAGDFSVVDTYVETRHGGVRFANHRARFGKQSVAGT
jgi:hypothetical protein